MASKRAMKAALRDECIIATDGILDPSKILFTTPETRIDEETDFPRLTYSVTDVPTRYNRGSRPQPYKIVMVNGEPQAEIYAMFYTLKVDLLVEGSSAATDEIYEALKTYWLAYEFWKDDDDLHADCTDVEIRGGGDEPVNTKTEPSVFETLLPIDIEYRKDVTREGKPIKNIYHHLDVDHDGTTDITYVTDESNSP